ncbi:MAG: di-trans,poly-cis-decaprenylcistransferase [Bacteroidaceae bacterium]|nr:di-trans,poly-cis-decaprenylcistransferase [Bacteroidaceae bacterium]
MTYQEQLDKNRIPQHVAIIMDGNGRWAEQRGKERTEGHAKGVEVVKKIMENAVELGIKYLTLYTFSTENWNRPEAEIAALMDLLFNNIDEEVFIKNHVRLRVVGDLERIPARVLAKINHCIDNTREFDRSTMVIALSYSSRWEITRAARMLAEKAVKGELDLSVIDEKSVSDAMTTSFMPDPELLIRTGGEIRLSNFLLWQAAYTELYFCDTFWPDFNMEELCKAIYVYQQRERRYGKTGAQVAEQNKTV